MPRTAPLHSGAPSDWLSLGPASRMLGVDPDTLRRWADEGRIRVFTTPGGHRRFSRTDVDRIATVRNVPPRKLAALGTTSDRLTRAYARTYRAIDTPPTLDRLETDARDAFRTEGRRLVAVILSYLDATRPVDRDRWEAEALDLIGATAHRLVEADASPTEVVAIFLRARQPLMGELSALGRRRSLDTSQLAGLLEQAVGLLDRLLLHLVATHADAVGPARAGLAGDRSSAAVVGTRIHRQVPTELAR
jgi:excisionase family DNA binding protein